MREETGNPKFDIQKDAAMDDLKGYAKFLKGTYIEMKTLVRELIDQIDNIVALTERTPEEIGLLESKK